MSNIKLNIIKLNKCIVYKPEFIDDDLFSKLKGPSRGGTNFGRFSVYFFGTPELNSSSIYLGLEYCTYGNVSYRSFGTNEARDDYYNNMIESIRLATEYFKEC